MISKEIFRLIEETVSIEERLFQESLKDHRISTITWMEHFEGQLSMNISIVIREYLGD